ncbi:hypothetical protein HYS31_02585 [Candidatus Woesearchaeota archaeon]|nr:hypothetical protein [Candidatus Woesearchaeota archaeon]
MTKKEMSALKKEAFELLKKEMAYIGIVFVIALAAFKIAFLNENFFGVLRVVASVFWLFVLPGYCVMLYWKESLEFLERFVIGTILSAGIIGILSYYLGLMGLNVKYHAFVLPVLMIAIGLIIFYRKTNKSH